MRRLPAEWETQDAVLLAWPHARTDWGPTLSAAETVYRRLVAEISRRERVVLVCADTHHRKHVVHLLRQAELDLSRFSLFTSPTNDTWTRDYGPITVLDDGRRTLVDFAFNGWGNKFPADLDDLVSRRLHAAGAFGSVDLRRVERVLEGGAIDSDGQGTLLAGHRSLRLRLNPGESLGGLTSTLASMLGVQRILWLERGRLDGDDTDGHVDTLARFCAPDIIAFVSCDDRSDPQQAELRAMAAELAAFRTHQGLPYRLVPLPSPAAKYGRHGERLPAGYANFLVINGAVLVPQYEDPADAVAIERLKRCFPDREVIGVPCLPLISQYGSLHCVTMHLPAENPAPCPESSASR